MPLTLHSLLVASQEGDVAKVRQILDSGEVGINAADEREITVLHVAAANSQEEVVSLLVARGASLEHADTSGWTALHQACYHGHTGTTATLLKAGAQPSPRNKYGATPLHMAAAAGHLSTVRELLGAGVAVEEEPSPHHRACPSPAMVAALHTRDAVLRSLLAGAVKVDRLAIPSRWTSLMMAAAAGSRTTAQILLEGGADPDRLNMVSATALEIAIALGHTEVHSFLAKRTTVQPRFPGQEQQLDLLGAAREGNLTRMEELLGSGDADVDDMDREGATAIILASIGGHLDVVKVG